MKLERQSTGEKIDISSLVELGAGGEARVFILGRTGLAAKVYHKATAEHAAKLAAMLASPPVDPMASKGHVSIAWPSDLLLSCDRHRKVLGYLMPLVTELDPIINFYNTKTRKSQHPLFSYCYLLRTARNLASSMCALHARGYVVGDINESNILVSETALVTLVDTDSFQVPDKANGKIYRCNVGKPEFTPPELQNIHFASIERTKEHDLFGLAVLIFQLLMEGNHPFGGLFTGRGESPSIEKCIANGYFPYAETPCGFYKPRPNAPPFETLPPGLRRLFLDCFEIGHSQSDKRPDAQAWQEALTEAENRLVICRANKQHQYGEHLSDCPWCERLKNLGGVDPFPSQLAVKQGTHTHKPNVVQVPLPSPSGGYVPPVAPRSAVAASRPNPSRQATAALRAATPARKSNPWLVRAVLFIILILVVFFEGRSLYRSYLANTTLSFGITVDGKDLPAGSTTEIQVDGQPFANGNQIGLGSHELKVALKDAEPFSEKFWVFGAKSLGPLPLESSKGSLSVTVNPSPATVELKRDGVLVRQGNAPLNMDKLSVGSYAMIVHRGDYSETYAIMIHRAQATKGQIDLDLGSAELSASPPDAEYDLSGNGRHWQGKLPVKLPEVPGGNYTLTVTRKGWPLTKTITISRANLTTDKIEFPYGSIAVTSAPPGMDVSTGGVDLGKTPTTLRELKPGQYVLSVTDGENDLVSVVNVGPKESASHNFVFHYGTVELSSTPSGATVIRKGKVVGTTPLTLEHIPTETTAVTLRLEDFATANVPIRAETGFTTNFAVKLFSNRSVATMDGTKQPRAANEFASARPSV
ncbi:MAG: PEGA domain-containing protein, partial [Verrucomicrobiota bacterium]